jgi:hypothetical protein
MREQIETAQSQIRLRESDKKPMFAQKQFFGVEDVPSNAPVVPCQISDATRANSAVTRP